MDISAFVNVALAGVLVARCGAILLPRYHARERRRHMLVILHRLKACGRTSDFELEALIDSSDIKLLLQSMEREGLVSSSIDKTELALIEGEEVVYYLITARGERYIEENTGLFARRDPRTTPVPMKTS